MHSVLFKIQNVINSQNKQSNEEKNSCIRSEFPFKELASHPGRIGHDPQTDSYIVEEIGPVAS